MSYESRILIVNKMSEDFASAIIDFHMGSIGYEIMENFENDVDFDVWAGTGTGESFREDSYGKPCKFMSLKDLYNILCTDTEIYRGFSYATEQIEALRAVLPVLIATGCNDYIAVFYGY